MRKTAKEAQKAFLSSSKFVAEVARLRLIVPSKAQTLASSAPEIRRNMERLILGLPRHLAGRSLAIGSWRLSFFCASFPSSISFCVISLALAIAARLGESTRSRGTYFSNGPSFIYWR
jgi:hypothetical protein